MPGAARESPRYNIRDCFETFTFPLDWQANRALHDIGEVYFGFRAALMLQNFEGLTDTYNRYHDPHEHSPEIHKLRELHEAMDRAVLEAYGWHDLAKTARCEFLLDYEDEDGDQGNEDSVQNPTPETRPRSRKRLPWRLRWPDEFRDEVLARLLELNEQRHKEELLAGKAVVRVQGSGAGDQGDDDDADREATDEDDDSPKPRKTATKSTPKPKAPRKSKKSPATGQQEMDF